MYLAYRPSSFSLSYLIVLSLFPPCTFLLLPHHSPPQPPAPLSLYVSVSMTGTGAATVCSMCGDVGFQDKLFRCARCRCRFQHSYCTNYYGDNAPASAGSNMCDWCLSDVAGKARSSSAAAGKQQASGSQESSSSSSSKSKGSGGEQESGRRATKGTGRRYKLLKDVLC